MIAAMSRCSMFSEVSVAKWCMRIEHFVAQPRAHPSRNALKTNSAIFDGSDKFQKNKNTNNE